MARSLLTQCAMLSHHDIRSLPAAHDEAARSVDALVVETFLKPQFRIGVVPASGELLVHVELRADEPRPRPLPRH